MTPRGRPGIKERTGPFSRFWFKRNRESLRAFCADTTFQMIWGTGMGVMANMVFPVALTAFLRAVINWDGNIPPLSWTQFIAISGFGWFSVVVLSRPQGRSMDLWRRMWGVKGKLV